MPNVEASLSTQTKTAALSTSGALPLQKTADKTSEQSSLPTTQLSSAYARQPPLSAAQLLLQQAFESTTFLVSAIDQPTLAPAPVPLFDCPTLEKFFTILEQELDTVLKACELPKLSNLNAVLATYPWDRKKQLIRRGKQPAKDTLHSQKLSNGLCLNSEYL